MSWAEQHDLKMEETHFVMSGEHVTVSADLLPPHQTDWDVNRRGDGKVCGTLLFKQMSSTVPCLVYMQFLHASLRMFHMAFCGTGSLPVMQ